jgi:hypothetical protein
MSEYTILTILGCFLAVFVGWFAVGFCAPWYTMRRRLKRAQVLLADMHSSATDRGRDVTDLDLIARELASDAVLLPLWAEFRHTLHAERSETAFDDAGQARLRYRQTVPAEVYFSIRALIDVPLRTNFFRHLPGILTGIGIIGTFLGLIGGLADFNVSGDPTQVNSNVEMLVDAVHSAFKISALAIILAMVITALEKSAVSGLHGRVQQLQQTIDGMFDAGAGEDYLSEIAKGSEQTAAHLGHLKEGMINELRPLFEELADKQSSASLRAADFIGEKINATLEEPLSRMTIAMEQSLEDQQTVVHELMDKSLEVFARRLEDVVGEKLTGSAEHIEAAASQMRSAMQDAPAQMEEAVGRVRVVLEDVAKSMEPMAEHAVRMTAAADQLATTVEQSAETLDYALERFKKLGTEMETSIGSADDISTSLSSGAEFANAAANAVERAAGQIDSASRKLTTVIESLSASADRQQGDADAHRVLAEAVERAAQQLSAAQTDFDGFLAGLADALADTHATFAREIDGTLRRTHEAFHQSLSTATEQLAGTVHGFGEFLETDFRDSVDNLQKEFSRLGNGHASVEG